MKTYLVILAAASLAACGGGGGSSTSAASAAPTTSQACSGGPYTTDATKVCTDAGGHLVTAYVYAMPTTVIPDGTIISSDTTWAPGGSPYLIAGKVQIAKGVTLTVPDNTIVEALRRVPCKADCIGTPPTTGIINVAGTLAVGGTNTTQLLGVTVSNISPDTSGGTVNIQHTVLQDAFIQLSRDASFSMTYSQALHLNVSPIVRAGVTTYEAGTNGYPSFRNSTIKYNSFIDSASFAFDPSVVMQNNLFVNMVDPLVLINDFPTNGQAPAGIARNNSFLFKKDSPNPNRMVIESHGTYDASAVHTLDFSNNFWGVTDNTTIQSRIQDSTNTSNPRLPNVINYAPPATAADPATPADPQIGTPNI